MVGTKAMLCPDWRALRRAEADAPLSEAERAYLEESVEALCAQLDDYQINHEINGLPPAAWESMRRERIFGVGLSAADGGHGFSPSAQSAVLLCRSTMGNWPRSQ